MMERYGYSIFCDDIRNEPGGKLSFIGCYNAVMFTATQFPLVLPKFCTHFHVFSPATKPYESILARCYVPGSTDPIAEEAIDVPSLHDQMDLLVSLPKNGAAPPCIVVAASLVFAAGSARIALTSRLSFSTISGGVPFGAPRPYQALAS